MAFTPRLSAPSTSDKHWIQIAYGGLNECIHIRGGSVLPNCFTRDTRFVTRYGVRSMLDCVGKNIEVLASDGKWKPATVKFFGRSQVFEVALSNGNTYKATANHRWIVLSQSGKTRYIKTTEELREGDLIPYTEYADEIRPDEDGIRHGFIFGDGRYGYKEQTSSALLCGKKREYMRPYFEDHKSYDCANGTQEYIGYPAYYKKPVDVHESLEYILGFLIGYIASDGCVADDGYTRISSAKKENVELVKELCAILGLRTGETRCEYRRGFNEYETPLYSVAIRRPGMKAEWFINQEHRARFEQNAVKPIRQTRVVSVSPIEGEQDVFCVVEPQTHSFTLAGGETTMNCVGYAWGRVFEINGKRPSLAKTNAENWYGYTADGYQRGQAPKLGAVMCWAKGKAGVASDGAGHVMVVEQIHADGTVTASGSDYSGRRFYTRTFSPGYYLGSAYTFQGFIYAAEVKDLPTDKIGTPVVRNTGVEQVEVLINDLRARKRPEMNDGVVLGFINPGIYNVLETRDMTAEASNGYRWYRVEADLWIATKEGEWTRHYEAQQQDDKDKRIAELEAELAKAEAAAASAEAAAAEQQARADGYKVIIDEAAAVLAKA